MYFSLKMLNCFLVPTFSFWNKLQTYRHFSAKVSLPVKKKIKRKKKLCTHIVQLWFLPLMAVCFSKRQFSRVQRVRAADPGPPLRTGSGLRLARALFPVRVSVCSTSQCTVPHFDGYHTEKQTLPKSLNNMTSDKIRERNSRLIMENFGADKLRILV